MSISQEEVDKITALAHLHFEPEERQRFLAEFTRILGCLDRIAAMDLTGITPTDSAPESKPAQHLREDRVHPGLSQEEILKSAPEKAQGFFVVPKVIPCE